MAECFWQDLVKTVEDCDTALPILTHLIEFELPVGENGADFYYGCSVGVDSGTGTYLDTPRAYVGAPDAGSALPGRVYIYSQDTETLEWSYVGAQSAGGDWQTDARLGQATDAKGDFFISGANERTGGAANTGAAYVWYYDFDGYYLLSTVLTASDEAANDFNGREVAISPGGAWAFMSGGSYASSSVYAFERSGGAPSFSSTYSEQQIIVASDAETTFGTSFDTDGDTLLVGAQGRDTPNSNVGAVYVFTRAASTWSQQQVVLPPTTAGGEAMGLDVQLKGTTFSVRGDSSGAAYVYKWGGSSWAHHGTVNGVEACALSDDGDYLVTVVKIIGEENEFFEYPDAEMWLYVHDINASYAIIASSELRGVPGFWAIPGGWFYSLELAIAGNTLVVGFNYSFSELPPSLAYTEFFEVNWPL